ncbi:MAG TPA: hypothetical protein V6C85_07850 [Allocoleopsis sp.]
MTKTTAWGFTVFSNQLDSDWLSRLKHTACGSEGFLPDVFIARNCSLLTVCSRQNREKAETRSLLLLFPLPALAYPSLGCNAA